jgi:hypothetical protein
MDWDAIENMLGTHWELGNVLKPKWELDDMVWNWGAVGNGLQNILKTIREPDWNPLGTWWEHICNRQENQKNPLPNPQKPKRKKNCTLSLHWLHQISISNSVCHHLQPGLIIPLYKQTGGKNYSPLLFWGHRVIQINLIMGTTYKFFSFLRGHIHKRISDLFWNMGHAPQEKHLFETLVAK